ncbi:hypothetical protein [Rhizobium ruizarguesonis]|uniref:hypothetical protein n=1 Tax=Rhizobium ruizarguesonis TaxID=2081791 RepID=UPI00371076C7
MFATAPGKAFAKERGWTGGTDSIFNFVQWLADNYPLKFRGDPIASWQRQAAKLRAQKDPHAALLHYHSFMTDTATIRETLMEAAVHVEGEIDAAIDRARGK